MTHKSLFLFIIFFFSVLFLVQGQGIKGVVTTEAGEPLPFASVYIRNLQDGVPTNENGRYEFKLAPGLYDVLVQHLGYASQIQTVEIKSDWVTLDFSLIPQVINLSQVEVKAGAEDPALTIMRKAISKSTYHRLQLQRYAMTVYLKGSGQLTDAPFFLKKKLAEEGLNINEAYTSEAVSRITFTLPNKVDEKVISIRTNGDNQGTSPARYIQTSFYQDQVNEVVSPLSKSAFIYYQFTFQGSFFDQNILISKIKVTPRSRGERVFEGFIYIIDELWAIHSLDLKTSVLGFQVHIRQNYSPIATNVWMPLTQQYTFGGKVFGFAGQFNYFVSTRDYDIKLNPDLSHKPELVDEKIQQAPINTQKFSKSVSSLEQLASEQPKTQKEYRKLLNQYEKEVIEERQEEEKKGVVSERNYEVDTLARKRDLAYWDSIRPVPLSLKEIEGYKRDDSLAIIEAAKKSEVDSIAKKARTKFKPQDLLMGGTNSFGKGRSIGFPVNLTKFSFNTVEGYKLGLGFYYRKVKEIKLPDSVNRIRTVFRIEPELRYGFSSEQFYGKVVIRKSHNKPTSGTNWGLSGGRFAYQFNTDDPIQEQVNASFSLFARKNYLKLYEQDFVQASWGQRKSPALNYQLTFLWADRRLLENTTDFSFSKNEEQRYTSNKPFNVEDTEETFSNHQAAKFKAALDWRPGLTYRIRNGRKIPNYERAPLLSFSYQKAIPQLSTSGLSADFDQLEASVKHDFSFGVSGKLEFNVTAGTFLNNRQVFFQDYKHFGGNRTLFSSMGAASNYRVMDYYRYSTSGSYISSIAHYQFRKFIFTQLPMLRFSGVRENIFVNYLKTQNSPHYTEIGYSLDNLFRIFRVELAMGFENGQFLRARPLFGVATFLNISID
ncbi:MAG: DUF5686 and carboxypeptidase regulatory-like domain-containing protein [Bacteroidetes bacterium]|nr:DUF5686 and carboxypeptidase regulatory-like domain-containing protein [Bacteroidota bacterium]MDA1268188.1 DUF5686 and carboxypeptidase regulatory-like domain-containing protein [Bacteroidota bacterium]